MLNKLRKGAAVTHLVPYKIYMTDLGKTINNNRIGEITRNVVLNSNTDESSSFGVLNRNKINNMAELFPKIKKLKDNQ